MLPNFVSEVLSQNGSVRLSYSAEANSVGGLTHEWVMNPCKLLHIFWKVFFKPVTELY